MLTSNETVFLCVQKRHCPSERAASGRPLGHGISYRSDYCFGADAADAADEAASAAALAAAAESAAAEAAASGAGVAAGGGVVSVVGAGASVLLPQALSTTTATNALIASLVFIYRYPGNLMITF